MARRSVWHALHVVCRRYVQRNREREEEGREGAHDTRLVSEADKPVVRNKGVVPLKTRNFLHSSAAGTV